MRFFASDCGVGSCCVWLSPMSSKSPCGSRRRAPPSSPPKGALRSWRAHSRSASFTIRRRKGMAMRRCTASATRQTSEGDAGRSRKWLTRSGPGSSRASRKASRKATRARNSAATSASTRSCVAMVTSRAACPKRSSAVSSNAWLLAFHSPSERSSERHASKTKSMSKLGSRGTAPMSPTRVAAWRPVKPRSKFFTAIAAACPRCSGLTPSCHLCQTRWNASNSKAPGSPGRGKRKSRDMSSWSP
mmetsp:Transcript_59845/g.192649  ORF Transcript_59845/g.192649 Transcript_59845/m.192649 type:complete len:245 (+) Transcript_59845:883-1617(+)